MAKSDTDNKKNDTAPNAQKQTTPTDGLLNCLVYMTEHFGHAKSANALTEGLPMDAGEKLTPDLFCQAASRIGLKSIVTKRKIKDIAQEILPVVLLKQDGDAVVFLGWDDKKQLRVVDVKNGVESSIPLKDMDKQYEGHAIFVEINHEPTVDDGEGHWFWQTVRDNKSIYIRVLVASVLINIFALTSPLFVMNVYDRVLPNHAIETGWVLGVGAISIFIFDFIMKALRGYFIDVAGRRADVILARRIYDHVLDVRLKDKAKSTGAFASNLREFESIRDFFTSATLAGFVDFPFSLFFIFIIWLIAGPVAFGLLFLYLTVLAVGLIIQIPVRKLVQKSMRSTNAKHGLLVETLSALETIKGVGGAGKFRKQYGAHVGESALWGQKSRYLSGLGVYFSGMVQQLTSVMIVLMGMYMVADGDLTTGGLIACVILGGRAISPVGQVVGLINKYHQAKMALGGLNNIMALPVERPADKKFLSRPVLKGGYQFRQVSFTYPDMKEPSVRNITFAIQPGERIGVIGRIGSGKSTLIKMMADFYEPDQGSVRLDGTDLRQIDPADLRRNMAYVGQDTTLFSGTVRDNITLSNPNATDEMVLNAAKMAGVDEFIRTHPMGYDAPVGERGEGFSGGQRQAIALSRAFLADPNILIFDEPTNAMDTQAEELLVQQLETYVQTRTLVLVTHRHSLLKLVDRLLLVEGGHLIADGPKEQVIEALNSGRFGVKSE